MREEDIILTSLLDCRLVDLYADPKPLSVEQKARFESIKNRRANHEPLQYILGQTDFWGMELKVDSRVLVPRPETELLVEAVIEKAKDFSGRPLRILDLGTGSGNIPIALAKNISASELISIDISEDALNVARENAFRHEVSSQIEFRQGDLFNALNTDDEKFDFIVSNPPYIPRGEIQNLPPDVQQEPRVALEAGEDGLCFYRQIIPQSVMYLKKDGILFLEIGDGQRDQIEDIFKFTDRYPKINFMNDYSQTPRIVIAEVKNG